MNEGTGDTVFDFRRKGNIATFGSGAARPVWQSGRSGSSIYFDGGDYIHSQGLGALSLPLTITASVKRTAAGGWDPIVITHEVNNIYYGAFLIIRNDNTVWLQFGDGTGNASPDRNTKHGTSSLAANRWYTIAGVIRGQNDMDIYIDGVDDGGSYSGTAATMNTSSGLPALGRWIAADTDQYLTGNIEYVYIFNRALSACEIALLHRKPFCMFTRPGRAWLSGREIVNLAGSSSCISSLSAALGRTRKTTGTTTGISDCSALLSSIRRLGGITSGVASANGHLSIAGESPPENELSRQRDALFNGVTANAFKLGTVLTMGWFWTRIKGCSVLYRGGSMEAIDFADMLTVCEPDDCEMSPPVYIPHNSDSTYFYVVRRFNGCGYREYTLGAAVKVSIDSNGELSRRKPNKVSDSVFELTDGDKIRLVWFYCPINQEAKPAGFNVYYDNRTGQIDYQNPLATIGYRGRRFYSFQSNVLTAGYYLFAVRAVDSLGCENGSLAQIKIQLIAANVNPINILSAEAV
jgi:hypothetical protein